MIVRGRFRRRRRGAVTPLVVAAVVCLTIVVLGALVGPLLLPESPSDLVLSRAFRPPVGFGGSWAHPLGADSLGRDLLTQIVYGARVSLLVGLVGATLGAIIGTVVGLVCGYVGGRVDAAVSIVVDAQLAIPTLVLGLAVVVAFQPSLWLTVLIIVSGLWVPFARVVRAQTMMLKEQDFVALARVSAVPSARLVVRHILPNVLPSILVLVTLDVGRVIIMEASLSFLGLGLRPPATSWGLVIADGRGYLSNAPWIVLAPGAALALTALSVNVIGDAVRDRLDPRLRAVSA